MSLAHFALITAAVAFALRAPNLDRTGDFVAMTPAEAHTVDLGVRAFAQTVAHDVSADGPSAWRKHFSADPPFFMAVNGKLIWSTGADAASGLQNVAHAYKKIDLQWGGNLRVDPLTPHLAMLASSYHEVQVTASDQHQNDDGFFTGLAEYQNGRWRFRNVHWSSAPTAPPQ
jgi:hypothetical protein